MTSSGWVIIMLLQFVQVLVQGAGGQWKWPSAEFMTDEEIVELLYTDPGRLRELSAQEHHGGGLDDTLTGEYPPLTGNELERPYPLEGDSSFQSEALPVDEGRASSYIRVQHFAPSSAKRDLAAYANLVLHT